MGKDLNKLFARIKPADPPENLLSKILNRVEEEIRLRAFRRRLGLSLIGVAGSVAAFIPSFNMLKTSLAESGFAEFLSLIFTDAGVIVNFWQDFIFSLLETFPAISLAVFLAVLAVFLGSIKTLVSNIRFFSLRHLIHR